MKLMLIMLMCYGLFYALQAMTRGQTVQLFIFPFLTPVAAASILFLVHRAMIAPDFVPPSRLRVAQ